MIKNLTIRNYKSIEDMPLDLGRFNVFIGENGAGKSNVLEAIALASAAVGDKLDNEFLVSRGVRVTRAELMRAAFDAQSHREPIVIDVTDDDGEHLALELQNDNSPYSKWLRIVRRTDTQIDLEHALQIPGKRDKENRQALLERLDKLKQALQQAQDDDTPLAPLSAVDPELGKLLMESAASNALRTAFENFLIYSPENSALRTFAREGQIQPLGINGEGLLKLLHVYAEMADDSTLQAIKSSLKLLNWFDDFTIPPDSADERLLLKDRFLAESSAEIDQKSANEGFLFLLFYFTLFNSKLTPSFFAIDNIDASLNPKLCHKMTAELARLARENGKQVILTTHNPAILDGLDLDDDEQRLFVISRGRNGSSKIKRIMKPAATPDQPPFRLSELFLRGVLGGLPKGF